MNHFSAAQPADALGSLPSVLDIIGAAKTLTLKSLKPMTENVLTMEPKLQLELTKAVIEKLTLEHQAKVKHCADKLRAAIREAGENGPLAFALVAAELVA